LLKLFKDSDLKKRKLIYIIVSNNFSQLLQNQNLRDSVDLLWNGTKFQVSQYHELFTVTQNLFSNALINDIKQEQHYFFGKARKFLNYDCNI